MKLMKLGLQLLIGAIVCTDVALPQANNDPKEEEPELVLLVPAATEDLAATIPLKVSPEGGLPLTNTDSKLPRTHQIRERRGRRMQSGDDDDDDDGPKPAANPKPTVSQWMRSSVRMNVVRFYTKIHEKTEIDSLSYFVYHQNRGIINVNNSVRPLVNLPIATTRTRRGDDDDDDDDDSGELTLISSSLSECGYNCIMRPISCGSLGLHNLSFIYRKRQGQR